MSHKFINELKIGEKVDSVYLVRKKEFKDFKDTSKGQFLRLEIGDKTGRISAVVWDNVEKVGGVFDTDDFVHITGRVGLYENTKQIIIESLERSDSSKCNPEDFIKRTDKDIDALLDEIKGEIFMIKNPALQRLLSSFFDDIAFIEKFKLAPAAKLWHHAYLGGLIEHTHQVLSLCKGICPFYPKVDSDLLKSAAILHDIGKIEELKYCGFIDYSSKGRLLGHIIISDNLVKERIREIDNFPPELEMRLRHAILSHHGEEDIRSPRVPMTIEAVILHSVDNLDAKVSGFIKEMEKDNRKEWTDYIKLIDRFIYIGKEDEGGNSERDQD
ncbi:MAG: HD domain-containing protein [bacterium]|nr:HD domain-containing protein [bacterium]